MSVDNASWQVAEQYFGRSCAHPTGTGAIRYINSPPVVAAPFNDMRIGLSEAGRTSGSEEVRWR
jgi:hypothetical protein